MPFACNSPYGSNSGSVASASTNLTDEIFSSIPATCYSYPFQAVHRNIPASYAYSFHISRHKLFSSHISLCQASGGMFTCGARPLSHSLRFAASPLPTDKVRCMSGHKKNSEWRGEFLWLSSGADSPEELRQGSWQTGFCVDAENGLSEPRSGEFDVFCIAFSKVLYVLVP